jgi:acetyltransferase (GNAT) family protein
MAEVDAPVGGVFPLFGGALVTVRPVVESDVESIVELFEELSGRCSFLRYFDRQAHLSVAEVLRLSSADGRDRLALVAERDDQVLAMGRYQRLDSQTEAVVVLLMVDEHHGVATVLLRELSEAAAMVGITHFVAEVPVGDRRMMTLFHDPGSSVGARDGSGNVLLRMAIQSAG